MVSQFEYMMDEVLADWHQPVAGIGREPYMV